MEHTHDDKQEKPGAHDDHHHDQGQPNGNNHHHKPHALPYYDPDYDQPHEFLQVVPDNLRFPDRQLFGQYATLNPPTFVPHPSDHLAFKPRKADFKAPFTCDGQEEELCIRKDHRMMTVDEQ